MRAGNPFLHHARGSRGELMNRNNILPLLSLCAVCGIIGGALGALVVRGVIV